MCKKSFILSSSGLKNILFIPTTDELSKQKESKKTNDYIFINDYFCFILGENEILMPRILAEFISPKVSHIHHADPTVNSIKLNLSFLQINESIIPELITNFKLICSGHSIDIDEEMSRKLSLLSILLGNEELHNEMNKLFPMKENEETTEEIDRCINYLYNYDQSEIESQFGKEGLINCISKNFNLIDKKKLFQLSLKNLYLILSDSNLKINNEDMLFDFINELFACTNKEDGSIEKVDFFELIKINKLSQNKRNDFLNSINSNDISNQLWENIRFYFTHESNQSQNAESELEPNSIKIEFNENNRGKFDGILCKLGEGNRMNALRNDIIYLMASSIISHQHQPENVLNLNDHDMFQSVDAPNSWICVDFKEHKVKPSHYSLMSNGYGGQGHFHPQTWIVEGSNDEVNWTILDQRQNDKSIDNHGASNIFEIENKQNNDYFRYIRIQQTGPNTYASNNSNYFVLTSIEFFGSIQNYLK